MFCQEPHVLSSGSKRDAGGGRSKAWRGAGLERVRQSIDLNSRPFVEPALSNSLKEDALPWKNQVGFNVLRHWIGFSASGDAAHRESMAALRVKTLISNGEAFSCKQRRDPQNDPPIIAALKWLFLARRRENVIHCLSASFWMKLLGGRVGMCTCRRLYLIGSWECISMGLGVPPGPPRVRASIKPRTTADRRAIPNSSSVYLREWKQRVRIKYEFKRSWFVWLAWPR